MTSRLSREQAFDAAVARLAWLDDVEALGCMLILAGKVEQLRRAQSPRLPAENHVQIPLFQEEP